MWGSFDPFRVQFVQKRPQKRYLMQMEPSRRKNKVRFFDMGSIFRYEISNIRKTGRPQNQSKNVRWNLWAIRLVSKFWLLSFRQRWKVLIMLAFRLKFAKWKSRINCRWKRQIEILAFWKNRYSKSRFTKFYRFETLQK